MSERGPTTGLNDQLKGTERAANLVALNREYRDDRRIKPILTTTGFADFNGALSNLNNIAENPDTFEKNIEQVLKATFEMALKALMDSAQKKNTDSFLKVFIDQGTTLKQVHYGLQEWVFAIADVYGVKEKMRAPIAQLMADKRYTAYTTQRPEEVAENSPESGAAETAMELSFDEAMSYAVANGDGKNLADKMLEYYSTEGNTANAEKVKTYLRGNDGVRRKNRLKQYAAKLLKERAHRAIKSTFNELCDATFTDPEKTNGRTVRDIALEMVLLKIPQIAKAAGASADVRALLWFLDTSTSGGARESKTGLESGLVKQLNDLASNNFAVVYASVAARQKYNQTNAPVDFELAAKAFEGTAYQGTNAHEVKDVSGFATQAPQSRPPVSQPPRSLQSVGSKNGTRTSAPTLPAGADAADLAVAEALLDDLVNSQPPIQATSGSQPKMVEPRPSVKPALQTIPTGLPFAPTAQMPAVSAPTSGRLSAPVSPYAKTAVAPAVSAPMLIVPAQPTENTVTNSSGSVIVAQKDALILSVDASKEVSEDMQTAWKDHAEAQRRAEAEAKAEILRAEQERLARGEKTAVIDRPAEPSWFRKHARLLVPAAAVAALSAAAGVGHWFKSRQPSESASAPASSMTAANNVPTASVLSTHSAPKQTVSIAASTVAQTIKSAVPVASVAAIASSSNIPVVAVSNLPIAGTQTKPVETAPTATAKVAEKITPSAVTTSAPVPTTAPKVAVAPSVPTTPSAPSTPGTMPAYTPEAKELTSKGTVTYTGKGDLGTSIFNSFYSGANPTEAKQINGKLTDLQRGTYGHYTKKFGSMSEADFQSILHDKTNADYGEAVMAVKLLGPRAKWTINVRTIGADGKVALIPYHEKFAPAVDSYEKFAAEMHEQGADGRQPGNVYAGANAGQHVSMVKSDGTWLSLPKDLATIRGWTLPSFAKPAQK